MNQTRITATAPKASGPGEAVAGVTVSTPKFLEATPEAIEGLCDLLALGIARRGGVPDPKATIYTAEPIGPQVWAVPTAGQL